MEIDDACIGSLRPDTMLRGREAEQPDFYLSFLRSLPGISRNYEETRREVFLFFILLKLLRVLRCRLDPTQTRRRSFQFSKLRNVERSEGERKFDFRAVSQGCLAGMNFPRLCVSELQTLINITGRVINNACAMHVSQSNLRGWKRSGSTIKKR